MGLNYRRSIVSLAPLLLSGCGAGWGWYVVNPADERGRTNLSFLVTGFTSTIELSVAATVLAGVLGLAVAACGLAPARAAKIINRVYVEGVRAAPPLVVLLWTFYGLPAVVGLRIDVFTAALIAIGVCDSAFQAEIFRAGYESIERAQHEAAQAVGLTNFHRLRLVILPQALRRILPPLANQFVYVVKMSSLASVIGFPDLTRKASELVTTVYRPLEIYSVLILEYLLLVLVISWLVRRLERRMAVGSRGSAFSEEVPLRIVYSLGLQTFDLATVCDGIEGLDLVPVKTAHEMAEHAASADALFVNAPGYTEAVANAARAAGSRVGWIQFMSAGYETATHWGVPAGVLLSNASSVWSPGVAEHGVGILLALLRQVHRLERDRAAHAWNRAAVLPKLAYLEDATIGMLGFGAIGKEMSARLKPFGAKIVGFSRTAAPRPGADEMHALAALADIAPALDLLCSVIALAPETRHIVSSAVLDRLPKHAVIVNVGRGATIDEAALIARLSDGRLAGAALDVFEEEPLPAASPMWDLPNVILSPHLAAFGGAAGWKRLGALCRENILRFQSGQTLLDAVSL